MERQEAEFQAPPPRGRLEELVAVQGRRRRRRRFEEEALAVAAGLLIRVAFKAAKDSRPSWNKEEGTNIIGALNVSCASAAFGLAGASLAVVAFVPRESKALHKVPYLLLLSLVFLSCCLGMLSAEEPLGMFCITLGVWISAGAAALLVSKLASTRRRASAE